MRLAFLVCGGVVAWSLVSCDGAGNAGEQSDSASSSETLSGDGRDRELQVALRELKFDERVLQEPDVMAAEAKFTEANEAFINARATDPATAALHRKDEELKTAITKAHNNGDQAEVAKLMKQYSKVRSELSAAIAKSESLARLREIANMAAKKFNEAEKAAVRKIPEGKELLQELNQ